MKTFTVTLKNEGAPFMFEMIEEEHENVSDIDFYGDELQLYFEDGGETSIKIGSKEKLEVEKE